MKRKQKREREGNLPGPQQPEAYPNSSPAAAQDQHHLYNPATAQQSTRNSPAQAKYGFGGFKNRARIKHVVVLVSVHDSAATPVGHDVLVDKLARTSPDLSEPRPTRIAFELIRGREDLYQAEVSRDRHLPTMAVAVSRPQGFPWPINRWRASPCTP